jgi:hypothetical protein
MADTGNETRSLLADGIRAMNEQEYQRGRLAGRAEVLALVRELDPELYHPAINAWACLWCHMRWPLGGPREHTPTCLFWIAQQAAQEPT